jgi:hypothetical protein
MDLIDIRNALIAGDHDALTAVAHETARSLQQLEPFGQSYERVEDAWPAWVRAASVFGGLAPSQLPAEWPGAEGLEEVIRTANANEDAWNAVRMDRVDVGLTGSIVLDPRDRINGTDLILTYGGGRTFARLHVRGPHAWVSCGVYPHRAPQTPEGLQSAAVSLRARLEAERGASPDSSPLTLLPGGGVIVGTP